MKKTQADAFGSFLFYFQFRAFRAFFAGCPHIYLGQRMSRPFLFSILGIWKIVAQSTHCLFDLLPLTPCSGYLAQQTLMSLGGGQTGLKFSAYVMYILSCATSSGYLPHRFPRGSHERLREPPQKEREREELICTQGQVCVRSIHPDGVTRWGLYIGENAHAHFFICGEAKITYFMKHI